MKKDNTGRRIFFAAVAVALVFTPIFLYFA